MEKVDLIIINAKVYTCNENFSVAESFCIKNGKFVEVNNTKEILKKYKSDNTLDAQGKCIYPGFIDAHSHFTGYGINLLTLADLTATKSFEELIDAVKKHQAKHDNFWIQGRGWDQNKWAVKEFPDKTALDEAFPNNPVYLIRIDGHAALVNSKALSIAGITAETKVEGGHILIKNGNPTGILVDNAMELVRNKIPKPDLSTKIKALKEAEKNCFSVGLTSVTDAGLYYEDIILIDSLQKDGSIKMRVNVMLEPEKKNIDAFVKKGVYITDNLSVRAIKLYADGALGSRGACLLKPYADSPQSNGLMVNSTEYLNMYCKLAIEHGYQVCTHAIGDSANRVMLHIYAAHLKGKNDLRWRIEHAQVVDQEDINTFGKFNIIPSIQTTHATSDMYWAGNRLGSERIGYAYAYKKLLEQNGWLCNGTDFPIENINPIYSFYAAVARKDLKGYPQSGFQMENALSRKEALLSMTIWAARASFEEHKKGSIENGKFADFVILDNDLIKVPLDSIFKVKLLETYVGGQKQY